MTRTAVIPGRTVAARVMLAALLVVSLFAGSAYAIDPPNAPPPKTPGVAEQTRVFRRALHLLKFTPLTGFNELDPKNSILIVLGDTRPLTQCPQGLRNFLEQGGAALIASDEPMDPAAKIALRDATGVTITGYTFIDPPRPDKCYRQLPFCPWMVSNDQMLMRHPQTGAPLQVATNLPSLLRDEGLRGNIIPRASMPIGSTFRAPPYEPLINLFGVGGEVGNGRVLVFADHSIFIDEMMRPTDNNNVELTANCMTFLRGNADQRTRVLFVDEGQIQTSFDVPTKAPKLPSPGEMADKVNQGLDNLQGRLDDFEKSDGFNRKFSQWITDPGGLGLTHPFRFVFIASALLLLAYGCYRLGIISRFHREWLAPVLARAGTAQRPRESLLEQRHDAVRDVQNVWEAARQLARDSFEAAGVAAPVPYREPAVAVRGWWGGRARRRRVLSLWRLAFGPQPTRIPPRDVPGLAAELERLKRDLKRGTIRLT